MDYSLNQRVFELGLETGQYCVIISCNQECGHHMALACVY